MSRDWYLLKGQNVLGPFSRDELRSFIKEGRLSPDGQLRKGASGPWIRASEIPWLRPGAKASRGSAKPAENNERNGLTETQRRIFVSGGAFLASTIVSAVILIVLVGRGGLQEEPKPRNVAAKPAADNQVDPEPDADDPDSGDTNGAADVAEEDADSVASTTGDPDATPPAEPSTEPSDKDQQPAKPPPVAQVPPRQPDLDPEPLLPPIPGELGPITDEEITDFERSVAGESRARHALARYRVFALSYEFTTPQRARVDAGLAEWAPRADEDLYRLGFDWVPLAEVLRAEQEAEQIIDRALALIEVGSLDESVEVLEDASRTYPNGIKADYILGLLYSLPFAYAYGPDRAEIYFRKVLQQRPNHAGALNSMAIAQIKQGDFHQAFHSLETAEAFSNRDEEIMQNLGRFLYLARSNRLPADNRAIRRFEELYDRLITAGAAPFDPTTGWLHMIPVFPASERETASVDGTDLVPLFGGSGFVVAPEYVLTNRHVVYDEQFGLGIPDAIGLTGSDGAQTERYGTIVAISDQTDLALLHVPGLTADPLIVHQGQSPLASEVLILGYPRSDVLGSSLKTTRGMIAGLPDPTRGPLADYYLFDANVDHGNSGGPVVDQRGRVISVLSASLQDEEGLLTTLAGGVTSDAAIQFLGPHLADMTPSPPDDEKAPDDWATVASTLSPSVLRLTCYYEAGVPSLDLAAGRMQAVEDVYEDFTCPACNGRSVTRCSGGCRSGMISQRYNVSNRRSDGTVIMQSRTRRVTCPTCSGVGTLDCPHCHEGFDAELF